MKKIDYITHEPLPDIFFCNMCGEEGDVSILINGPYCPCCKYSSLIFDYSECHYEKWDQWYKNNIQIIRV